MQKIYLDRILKRLSNLQFAIGILFTIVIIIAIGTIIEQDQSTSFYQKNYPEENPILGFISWKLLLALNLDHVYTSYWFILLLLIFGLSLISCTLTVQLPTLQRLRRWKFYGNLQNLRGITNSIPINKTDTALHHLYSQNYTIFRQGEKYYAYSGLVGRLGPVVVHMSLILLLIGSTIGSFTGYTAQEFIPRGEVIHIQNLVKTGRLSYLPQDISYRVNDFWITYTNQSNTSQFYSDLSLIDNIGNEIKRKVIFVNEPLVYKGVTLYQTDWDIVGLKYSTNNGKIEQLPLTKIIKNGQKFWLGNIKNSKNTTNLTVLCRDLSGKIYLYDTNGAIKQEFELGNTLFLDNQNKVIFSEFLTSTGLQVKTDPGIKIVYLAFFFLMVSTYVSFFSYSQIWGSEKANQTTLLGISNRAVLMFQKEFRYLIEKILGRF